MATAPVTGEASHGRSSVREGMGFAVASFASAGLLQLVSAVLTARLYGVETIGEYSLVIAPWLTVVQFSNVAEQTALTRRLATVPARDPRVGALFLPVLGFSALLTAGAAAVVWGLSVAAFRGPIGQPDLVVPATVVLAAYVLVDNTSWNLDAVFAAFRSGRSIFAGRVTQVASFLTLAGVLAPVARSVWSLTAATVASFVLALLARLPQVRRFLAWPSIAQVREGARELPALLGFALRIVPGRFAGGMVLQSTIWVIGALLPVAAVGAFNRAMNLATRLSDVSFRVGEILMPALAERHAHADREGFERLLIRTIRYVAVPLFLVVAVGGGAARGILQVFGPGFDRASDALALLLLAFGVGVVTNLQTQAFDAAGRPTASTLLTIARAVVSIGLLVPATARFGAAGTAGSVAVGYVLTVVWRHLWLRRRVLPGSVPGLGRTGAAVLFAGLAGFGAARVLDTVLVQPLGLLAGGAAGAAAYAAVALAAGAFTREEVASGVAAARRRLTRPRQPTDAPTP